jgi:multisubunit Na+/H+ antiporter MnhB subunit
MTPRRSIILDTTIELVFDAAMVGSVYFLFAGHNQPGGGFIGGLIAGAAIALRYIAGGLGEVRMVVRIKPWIFLALGLALASGTALVPLLVGSAVLDQTAFEGSFALLGKVKLTTATIFDAGVYLIVIGLVLMLFEGLGEDWRELVATRGEEPRANDGELNDSEVGS